MPEPLRVSYARGVTPGKWARIWNERFPRVRLELTMVDPVTDAAAQLAPLRDGTAALAFIRLPADENGEPTWPGAGRPDDMHFIALYEELPYVVAPKGNVLEAADRVTAADLAGEVRHPFDDDVATTVEIVAANVGVVIVPQSLARLYARKDVIARPAADQPGWRIGLAWPRASADARAEDFVGVVRGRTANSSRGVEAAPAAAKPAAPARTAGTRAVQKPSRGRPSRGRPSRGRGRRS